MAIALAVAWLFHVDHPGLAPLAEHTVGATQAGAGGAALRCLSVTADTNQNKFPLYWTLHGNHYVEPRAKSLYISAI